MPLTKAFTKLEKSEKRLCNERRVCTFPSGERERERQRERHRERERAREREFEREKEREQN
jgi:hypothetical protein